MIRVREFTMCEIEHFVDPNLKQYSKFNKVKNIKLTLLSACDQMDGKASVVMTIGDAVAQKIVDNETLGYYMARTHLFLLSVGVDPKRLRFRQHMSNEMAHYAQVLSLSRLRFNKFYFKQNLKFNIFNNF